MTACPVCLDTGIVQCPDPDRESVYETACPERIHDGQPCLQCGGSGYVEGPGCNCGVGPAGYYGMHERHCGLEPCPFGCPFVAPVAPPEVAEVMERAKQRTAELFAASDDENWLGI